MTPRLATPQELIAGWGRGAQPRCVCVYSGQGAGWSLCGYARLLRRHTKGTFPCGLPDHDHGKARPPHQTPALVQTRARAPPLGPLRGDLEGSPEVSEEEADGGGRGDAAAPGTGAEAETGQLMILGGC